jgi:hypothetical protein
MLTSIKQFSSRQSLIKNEVFPYFFLVLLVFISRFIWINSLGLYEDDWLFIGTAITNSFEQNWSRLYQAYTTFWQGRPFFMTFITLIPVLSAKLGGLKALYSIGYIFLSTNVCLLYKILKKVINQPYIPFFTALFFCLYPSDTTFILLLHLFELQISLLFLLLAFNFYLNSKPIISYGLSICSLLTYETPFLTFLAASFLLRSNNNKKTTKHFIVLILIAGIYLGVRRLFGESRVIDLDFLATLKTLAYQVTVGPLISLSMFFVRPLQVLAPFRFANLLVLLIATPIFFFLIYFLTKNWFNGNSIAIRSNRLQETKRLLLIGVFTTIFAYPTAITLDVNLTDGRASRVHFAAAFGTALIIASLWAIVLNTIPRKIAWKKITVLLLSLHLSGLLAFCLNVQYFYQLSWSYQQAFWKDVLQLAPDIDQDTVILVQAPDLQWGKQINPFDWSMPSILSAIYQFSSDWQHPPRLYVLNSQVGDVDGWKRMINEQSNFVLSSSNNSLRYYYAWEPERTVNSQNIILLVEENGYLVRKRSLEVASESILLKYIQQPSQSFPEFTKSILFKELISDKVKNTESSSTAIYFKPQA